MNTSNERRNAAGDLSFTPSTDPIIQARNNLRYWIDRTESRGSQARPVLASELMEAARYMITTIDNNHVGGSE